MYGSTYFLGYRVGNITLYLFLALFAIYLVAGARILSKSGQSGWKIIIPIYGTYCLYKAADSEGLFYATIITNFLSSLAIRFFTRRQMNDLFIDSTRNNSTNTIILVISGIVLLLIHWIYSVQLAESFGKGKGFAFGLFVLFPVFAMILGFGSAEYAGGAKGLKDLPSSTGTWKCSFCDNTNPVSRGTCSQCGKPR